MKKNIWFLLLLVLFLSQPSAWGTGPKNTKVKVGAIFSFPIASNPTTGYSWKLLNISDKKVIQSLGSKYAAPKTNLVGAGGKETWIFKAIKKGKSQIELGYLRPWEKGIPPVDVKTFEVVVR